ELHQDLEARRDSHELVQKSRALASEHRNLHRAILQPAAATLSARLSLPGGVERQAQCQSGAVDSKGAMITFVADRTQSSTRMPEQGTQAPSPAPDLIPAGETIETIHER